jgi:hypothetical protein
MAYSRIIHTKSEAVAAVPSPTSLSYGEIAINYSDGHMYIKKADNKVYKVASTDNDTNIRALLGDVNIINNKLEFFNIDSSTINIENLNVGITGGLSGDLKNTIAGDYVAAIGRNNSIALGAYDGACIGNGNTIGISTSFGIIGTNNTVDANNSLIAGKDNTVTSVDSLNLIDNCIVLGKSNIASQDKQYIIGDTNTVTTKRAYVLGSDNNISGKRAYVLGGSNTISGNEGITVIGQSNSVTNENSFVIGNDNSVNIIKGEEPIAGSIAIGYNNSLFGQASFALGIGLIDNVTIGSTDKYDESYLIGQYNDRPDSNSEIHFGTGNNDSTRYTSVKIIPRDAARSGIIMKALQESASYADDAAAATGGVEVGELYRTGSTVKIRMA